MQKTFLLNIYVRVFVIFQVFSMWAFLPVSRNIIQQFTYFSFGLKKYPPPPRDVCPGFAKGKFGVSRFHEFANGFI